LRGFAGEVPRLDRRRGEKPRWIKYLREPHIWRMFQQMWPIRAARAIFGGAPGLHPRGETPN
jgi:hypothetical protein